MLFETSKYGQVIPGIKDEAGELSMRQNKRSKQPLDDEELDAKSQLVSESNDERERDDVREVVQHGSDYEAGIKNLTFMGVPNSSKYGGESNQDIDAQGVNQNTKEQKLSEKPAKFLHQDSFWKREFDQALRRLSRLTSVGKLQTVSADNGTKPQDMQLEEQDKHVRNMASDFIDTMIAGVPGAMFAGTIFLKDDNGVSRAPLLLSMLSIRVSLMKEKETVKKMTKRELRKASVEGIEPHLTKDHGEGYHSKYLLELEYGLGENRLKWSIIRSYKDIASLHGKLKLISFQQNTLNKLYIDNHRYSKMHLPHFPRFDDATRKQEHEVQKRWENDSITDMAEVTPKSSLQFSEKKFSLKHLDTLVRDQDDFTKPMHHRIERYFSLLNLALSLRPQANKLFQFYELSPIGNLLSYENGLAGKQGYMIIRSTAKSQGWRVSHFKFNDFKAMIERHTNKWFLVRHSYITFVTDICSTTPLDVFLVDSKFKVSFSGDSKEGLGLKEFDPSRHDYNSKKISTKLLITVENSERKMQMIVKSQYLLRLWAKSIIDMSKLTIWSREHRFGSFAPVRKNCFCKFLVDGRDYFWSLSEALMMAEDVIYIHDWWLSPELYMRRPVEGNQGYRLDRILKAKAEQNVKIFIVVYRNVGSTVGTDSLWTKHSLLSLHSNIHVIRSPNQWLQNTYFWAHHEKFVVIDNTVAFIGGIDLCYGRYDTPDHVLHDEDIDLKRQVFPGKDYSNARICDFYNLDKPFESMYDRSLVPRMPWHDVQMMTVGEGARDLSRHFVQRWNYLLRQKRPSRPTPLLTPASDFTREQLESSSFFKALKVRSTCELQVIRSAGNWSLGLKETEDSIHQAYLKLIETSEHYIYIENQFFVTSSSWDGVEIENKIGDAIVDRIVKANSEQRDWKAFILIPLMPGFNAEVDETEGSSVRVIMQCQFQSISRGETSVFAKLKKLNIDPTQYIQFYSLRKWSTIGPDAKLVTEQLYVHAKLMIVDDRSCVIGSANINERSMNGNRDSEVAVIIRDNDLVKSKMNTKEYYAGRFPLELRQRLMREHLGCDVDLVDFIERKFERIKLLAADNWETLDVFSTKEEERDNVSEGIENAMIEVGYREIMNESCTVKWFKKFGESVDNFGILNRPDMKTEDNEPDSSIHDSASLKPAPLPQRNRNDNTYYNVHAPYHSFNHRAGEANKGIRDKKNISLDSRLINNAFHVRDVDGHGPDDWKNSNGKAEMFNDVNKQLHEWAKSLMTNNVLNQKSKELTSSFLPDRDSVKDYLLDSNIQPTSKWSMLKRICYLQYLSFKKENNLYEVQKNGKVAYSQKSSKNNSTKNNVADDEENGNDAIEHLLRQFLPSFNENNSFFPNVQYVDPYIFEDPLCEAFSQDLWYSIALRNTVLFRMVFHCQPDNFVQTWREYKEFQRIYKEFDENQEKQIQNEKRQRGQDVIRQHISRDSMDPLDSTLDDNNSVTTTIERGKTLGEISKHTLDIEGKQNAGDINLENCFDDQMTSENQKLTESHFRLKITRNLLYGFNDSCYDRHTARKILERIHGHLVIFPADWLAKEVEANNWFYNVDRLPPIDIYD